MYKLSFLLHSLFDNGAKMTPKRRFVFSLIFIVKLSIMTALLEKNRGFTLEMIDNNDKSFQSCVKSR